MGASYLFPGPALMKVPTGREITPKLGSLYGKGFAKLGGARACSPVEGADINAS